MQTQERSKEPVTFILDEFPNFGYMRQIAEGITYLAGFDVNLWLFAQNLNQLESVYPKDHKGMLSEAHIKQFFGTRGVAHCRIYI